MTKQQFKHYFDTHFDAIRNYIYYRCGDEALATDATQEAFLKLWEKRDRFAQTHIKSLLYKMAKDCFINQVRKNKVKNTYLDQLRFEFETNDPENQLRYQELKTHYERSLGKLPERERVVFLMSRMDGLTYKEIAERLALSPKTIEKRMSSALKALRKAIRGVLSLLFILLLNS